MSQLNLDTLYRQVIMDQYQNPRNRGSDEEDTLNVQKNDPTDGDHIFLEFHLDEEVVVDIRQNGVGCALSLASASMMTEAIKGQSISKALDMSELFSQMMLGEEIDVEGFGVEDIEALQGVSNFPARIKCATLAWKAMEKVAKEQ